MDQYTQNRQQRRQRQLSLIALDSKESDDIEQFAQSDEQRKQKKLRKKRRQEKKKRNRETPEERADRQLALERRQRMIDELKGLQQERVEEQSRQEESMEARHEEQKQELFQPEEGEPTQSSLAQHLVVVDSELQKAVEGIADLAQTYEDKKSKILSSLTSAEKYKVYTKSVEQAFEPVSAQFEEAVKQIQGFHRVARGIQQQTQQLLKPGGGVGKGFKDLWQDIKNKYKGQYLGLTHRVERPSGKWKSKTKTERENRVKEILDELYPKGKGRAGDYRRREMEQKFLEQVRSESKRGLIAAAPMLPYVVNLKTLIVKTLKELDNVSQVVSDQVKGILTTYFSDDSPLLEAAAIEREKMKKGLLSNEDKESVEQRKEMFQKMWGDGQSPGAYAKLGESALYGALANLQEGTAQLPVILGVLPEEISGIPDEDQGAFMDEDEESTNEKLNEALQRVKPQAGNSISQVEINKLQRRLAEQNRQRRRRHMRQLQVSE